MTIDLHISKKMCQPCKRALNKVFPPVRKAVFLPLPVTKGKNKEDEKCEYLPPLFSCHEAIWKIFDPLFSLCKPIKAERNANCIFGCKIASSSSSGFIRSGGGQEQVSRPITTRLYDPPLPPSVTTPFPPFSTFPHVNKNAQRRRSETCACMCKILRNISGTSYVGICTFETIF